MGLIEVGLTVNIDKKVFSSFKMSIFSVFHDPRTKLSNDLMHRRLDSWALYDLFDDRPGGSNLVKRAERLKAAVLLFGHDGPDFVGDQTRKELDDLLRNERIVARKNEYPVCSRV